MAIVRPTTKTLISTTNWGIPITDEVNRLTPLVDNKTPTAWTPFTLLNGWVTFDVGSYGNPSYRKIGDMVQMRGVVKSGTGDIAVLPVGFRPPFNMGFAVAGSQTNPAAAQVPQIAIFTNGNLYPYDAANVAVHFGFIQFSTT